MTFLPIVERELRVAARQKLTHWSRFGAALLALAVMFWLLAVWGESRISGSETGKLLFTMMSSLSFFFCLAVGGYATADCISAERRHGTLGLLFLTDLKGYDVVLGKLAASSVGTVYALLAIVPVLAVPLLMGGVVKELVWCAALGLLNTLFFALTAGLFVSSVSRDERKAVSGTLGLIAGITAGLPALAGFWQMWFSQGERSEVAQALTICSPAFGFFDGLFGPVAQGVVGWRKFVPSMLITHVMAWLFLGLACVIVPRTWREHGENRPQLAPWRERLRRDGLLGFFRRSKRVLDGNPVAWLVNRQPGRMFGPWTVLVFCGAGWLVGMFTVGEDWLSQPVPIFFMVMMHGLLKYDLSGSACRRFAEDRQSGAMELLLATPLTVEEILQGQRIALWRRYLGPVVVVLVADALLFSAGMKSADGSDAMELVASVVACMVMLVVDAYALSWLGMWEGMTSRSFMLAWVKTMAWLLWLPWVVFIFLSTLSAASTRGNTTFSTMLVLWLVICGTADVVFTVLAKAKLASNFREYAAGRYNRRNSPTAGAA